MLFQQTNISDNDYKLIQSDGDISLLIATFIKKDLRSSLCHSTQSSLNVTFNSVSKLVSENHISVNIQLIYFI